MGGGNSKKLIPTRNEGVVVKDRGKVVLRSPERLFIHAA